MYHEKPPRSANQKSVNDSDNTFDEYKEWPPIPAAPNAAANDHYMADVDLNFNYDPDENNHSGSLNKLLTVRIIIVAVVLAMLAAIAVVSFLLKSEPSSSLATDESEQTIKAPTVSGTYFELEQLANRIILTNRWNEASTEKLAELWGQLDRDSRIVALQAVWFEQFTFKLQRQANELLRAKVESDPSISLARKLGLKGLYVAKPSQYAVSDDSQAQDDSLAGVVLGSDSANQNKATKKQESLSNGFESDEQTENSDQENNPTAVAHDITASDIKNILNRYSKSYIFGDISALDKLFINDKTAEERDRIETFMQDYKSLLNTSVQRWVEFQNLSWAHGEKTAVGKGQIKFESKSRDNDRTSTTANLVIKLRRLGDEIKVSALNFSNQKISHKKSQPAKLAKSKESTPSSSMPSLAELQGAVSRFVSAYDSGDLEAIDKLFSKNIISNKGTTKSEIRDEYENLFSTSRKRQMIIQDLRWKFAKKSAKGVGALQVVVVGKDNDVNVVKGKIQFVTKKINNQILITHLYQLKRGE